MGVFSTQRHCRLKHSGDVRVVIGLKQGGTVEERFVIDAGNGEADSVSTPPGRPEGPGDFSLVIYCMQKNLKKICRFVTVTGSCWLVHLFFLSKYPTDFD
jgi:hypothetical protein